MMAYPCNSSPASESRICKVAGESGRNELVSSFITRLSLYRNPSQLSIQVEARCSSPGQHQFQVSNISVGFQLSGFSSQLSALQFSVFSFQFSAFKFQISAFGFRLSAFKFQVQVSGSSFRFKFQIQVS